MVPPLLPRAHSAVSVISTIAASARLPAAATARRDRLTAPTLLQLLRQMHAASKTQLNTSISGALLHSQLLFRPAAQPEAGSASGTSGTYGWAQGEPRGIRASTPGARVFPWCFL